MILLASLEEAKTHLRILNNDSDSDIESKLATASEMVLRYMKLDSVPQEWLTGSPPEIDTPYKERGITLAVLSSLYEGREADTINIEAIDRVFVLMLDPFPDNGMTWGINTTSKKATETRLIIVSFQDKLGATELLSGTPTALEWQSSALTITDAALSTLEYVQPEGIKVLPQQAVQFFASGGIARQSYTIRLSSGTTLDQILVKDYRLLVT